ncbi:MAG: LysM peptidoglycan-binding domain-containing protein [Anaerolineales bacterium]|nr:MAG: LysM peptidoglycan-binding domain-containing protein [Anaerolineales bacterium]
MFAQIGYTRSQKWVVKVFSLVLVLTFLAAALPAPSLAASASKPQCSTYHKVKSGDSLVSIAKYYKVNWTKIAEANNIIPPYTLYVGQSLCIPKDKTGVVSGAPTAQAASFKVLRNGDNLVIRAYNFPTKSFYYVKVDDFKVDGLKWYKLGILRTRKANNVEASFQIPKDLRKAYYFYVCLKNAVTDKVTCQAVYAW